jgi:hypothetical protein
MSFTFPIPEILTDPGALFAAPEGNVCPPPVAERFGGHSYSTFGAWPAPWRALGATLTGSVLRWDAELKRSQIQEKRTPRGTVDFTLCSVTAENLALLLGVPVGISSQDVAYVGDAIAASIATPQGVPFVLGWESLDHTVRYVITDAKMHSKIMFDCTKAPKLIELECHVTFEKAPEFYLTGTRTGGERKRDMSPPATETDPKAPTEIKEIRVAEFYDAIKNVQVGLDYIKKNYGGAEKLQHPYAKGGSA